MYLPQFWLKVHSLGLALKVRGRAFQTHTRPHQYHCNVVRYGLAAQWGLHLHHTWCSPICSTLTACTQHVEYLYPQLHGSTCQKEPKNVKIGQEMREI
jgi:hypothetical protein